MLQTAEPTPMVIGEAKAVKNNMIESSFHLFKNDFLKREPITNEKHLIKKWMSLYNIATTDILANITALPLHKYYMASNPIKINLPNK